MKRQNVRTLSLVVCTFTYLLVGAAIFDALESDFEQSEYTRLRQREHSLCKHYNISKEDFEKISILILKMKSYKAGTQWKFAGAFYFATTVITTIGYGHSTPKTTPGKVFCMIYAAPGIPLCIVMFQSIGERINAFITFLLKQIKKILRFRDRNISQTNLILVSFNMGTIVLTAGASAFAYYEKWPYLDSFYYCFITLTTIGFGDFVALQRNDSLSRRPDYVAFSLIFILFGLTVVSSAMNLLVLRFLTMNTADKRREEIEAAVAAREAMCLEGDVITANGGLVPAVTNPRLTDLRDASSSIGGGGGSVINVDGGDLVSVCSCTCFERLAAVQSAKMKRRRGPPTLPGLAIYPTHRDRRTNKVHYTVTRSPGKILHLLPMTTFDEPTDEEISPSEDSGLINEYQKTARKRASI